MKAVDTSLIVAAFASWHEKHEPARRVLDAGVRAVDHCVVETYSVLTRLPAPHRAAAHVVLEFLGARFRAPFLRLGAQAHRRFVLGLAESGVAGGAVYDALVAATAAEHGAELLSCDRRASSTYERYGIRFRLL